MHTNCCLALIVPVLFFPGDDPMKKGPPATPAVELRMEYRDGNNPKLALFLTNKGQKDLKFVKLWLPWNGNDFLTLLLLRADGSRKQLEDSTLGMIQDPAPVYETLKPNQTVTGEIVLRDRFRTLAKTRSETGIDVFWSYQPWDSDGTPLKRVGGWLYIPKSKP